MRAPGESDLGDRQARLACLRLAIATADRIERDLGGRVEIERSTAHILSRVRDFAVFVLAGERNERTARLDCLQLAADAAVRESRGPDYRMLEWPSANELVFCATLYLRFVLDGFPAVEVRPRRCFGVEAGDVCR